MKNLSMGLCIGFLVFAQVASTHSEMGYQPSPEIVPASTLAAGKLGVIGDSLAAGTHSSEMCGNNDIIDCVNDLMGLSSYDWSYVGGNQRWSLASLLGYTADRVLNAADNGAEWKDALNQAKAIMAYTDVETVFIGLGANDVCQPFAADYTGDLENIARHIDETLIYLTDHLPAGGRIYWSGVPDIVLFRDLMIHRNHNYMFESCQATWDLDSTKIKDGAANDACDHYFDHQLCQLTSYNEEGKDRLMELIIQQWLAIEGVEEGACGKVFNSRSTDQDRQEARQFNIALNQLMAQKAQAFNGRNGIAVNYSDQVYEASASIQPYHVSRLDCFHPSRAGQMKLAYEIWRSFNLNHNLFMPAFLDEFDSPDYCQQELTIWDTCWTEIGENDGPFANDIQVLNQELRVRDNDKGIWRGVNLAGVEAAWMSFNWRREDLDSSSDYVSFAISPNGGQTWYTLDQFRGDGDDYGMQRGSYYNITPYATATTRFRLFSSSSLGDQDKVYFDNVNITAWRLYATARFELLPGLNMVGIPVDPAPVPDVASLLNILGTPATIRELRRFNQASGLFARCAFDASGNPVGDACNAPIVAGDGWLVEALAISRIEYPVNAVCATITLSAGLNIVAFPCAGADLNSYRLLQALGDNTTVASIQTFDIRTGRWLTTVYDAGQPAGHKFAILPGYAYLVNMHREASVTLAASP